MRHAVIAVVAAMLFAATVLAVVPAPAQTPPPPAPENLAAAHQLIDVMKATDQFKAVLPILITNLKGAIVQNRPDVEKQYDAMMPIFAEKAQQRLTELTDTMAEIYARNFTLNELHDLVAFYQTPTGQKFIERQPVIAQASMAAGRTFGQSVARDVQDQMKQPN
jgi:uncharacterized protein